MTALPPGPWNVVKCRTSFSVREGSPIGRHVATVSLGYDPTRNLERGEAIAKAIAAVPDMVAALKLIVEAGCDCLGCIAGRAALKKAGLL